LPGPNDKTPGELWRQAQALAAAGRNLEALRLLYLAILFLLDRQRLLRYETARTNGEYVRQVRLTELAPAGLHESFEQLTKLFDVQWYGEGSCGPAQYQSAERIASEVRDLAAGM
jgi:Domain of unknown function (DUF4129)